MIQGNQRKNRVIGHLNGDLNQVLNQELLAKFKEQVGLNNKNSNVPLANFAYNFLKERGINVHTPAELVRDWDIMPNESQFYFDSCGVAVYQRKGSNEQHRQRVLGIIGRTSTDTPLIVTGLNVSKDGNTFKFEDSEYVQVTEAPYLQRDGKVQYDEASGELVRSKNGVTVLTPKDQDGLRRVYRNRNDVLDGRNGNLSDAIAFGRVPIWQATESLDAKIFEEQAIDSELAGLSPEYLSRINDLLKSEKGIKYFKDLIQK